MNKISLFMMGIIVFIIITILVWLLSNFLFPSNGFTLLESWGIVNVYVVISSGFKVYNDNNA